MTTLVVGVSGVTSSVVEAYRLDRYNNSYAHNRLREEYVVEAYRLDRYDNSLLPSSAQSHPCCRSLSFG